MASAARFSLFCLALLALAACSDVSGEPSPLVSRAASAERAYVLEKTVKAKPSGGKSRALKEGSVWTEFGTVAEGTVYRPRGAILTAEGVNVREAYIVVRDRTWVGFWLPVEKAFAPVDRPVPIEMKQGERD
jgi:hypothetical protein